MQDLTFTKVIIRGVDVPLKKPIIAHIGTFKSWPYLCVDVLTKEGMFYVQKNHSFTVYSKRVWYISIPSRRLYGSQANSR